MKITRRPPLISHARFGREVSLWDSFAQLIYGSQCGGSAIKARGYQFGPMSTLIAAVPLVYLPTESSLAWLVYLCDSFTELHAVQLSEILWLHGSTAFALMKVDSQGLPE